MKKLAAILAFVLVLLTFTACGSAAYEKPMKNLMNAIINNDPEKYCAAFVDPFYEEYLKDQNKDLDDMDDIVKEYKSQVKEISKQFKDSYGDNIKVKYEIDRVRKFTKEDVTFLGEYLDEKFDYDAKAVKDVVVITGYTRITGDEASEKEPFEEVMIKVNGKWYISFELGSLSAVKSAIESGSGIND